MVNHNASVKIELHSRTNIFMVKLAILVCEVHCHFQFFFFFFFFSCDFNITWLLIILILLSLAPQPSLGLGLLLKIRLNFLEASQQFSLLQGRVVSSTPNPPPGGPGLCIYISQRQGGYPFQSPFTTRMGYGGTILIMKCLIT
jgi:hypothetical protein